MNNDAPLTHEVTSEQDGLRLDQVLAQLYPQRSRAKLQTWVELGAVTLNQHTTKNKTRVREGDLLWVKAPPEEAAVTWTAQPQDLAIVHEDAHLIVVDKQAGLVVHPGAGNPDHTLVNALLHHDPCLAQLPRAGIVHRLDKDTTGLLVVARTLEAHQSLVQQLKDRTVKRRYLAIVNGTLTAGGMVDAPMGRHRSQRTKMAVSEGGKQAITHYRIQERFRAHTLLQLDLETGRTHQIRVHMSHLRHPIVGDKTYGARPHLPPQPSPALRSALTDFPRQALHAHTLGLIHPAKQTAMDWQAPMPADMMSLLQALKDDLITHAT